MRVETELWWNRLGGLDSECDVAGHESWAGAAGRRQARLGAGKAAS